MSRTGEFAWPEVAAAIAGVFGLLPLRMGPAGRPTTIYRLCLTGDGIADDLNVFRPRPVVSDLPTFIREFTLLVMHSLALSVAGTAQTEFPVLNRARALT